MKNRDTGFRFPEIFHQNWEDVQRLIGSGKGSLSTRQTLDIGSPENVSRYLNSIGY